ncbi:MAG: hypothetical protein VW405_03460 [Rhodospirillaceae bacterium]
MDNDAKAIYDRLANFESGALVGLRGPSALTLHSPGVTKHALPLNNFLRFETDFGAVIREVVILATAREMDSKFEWSAHEPEALKEGVAHATIDVITFRRPTDGVPEAHALLIEYVRQVLQTHRVSSELFARLNAAYGAKGVIELATLIGGYVSLAVVLATVDAQVLDNGLEELPVDP